MNGNIVISRIDKCESTSITFFKILYLIIDDVKQIVEIFITKPKSFELISGDSTNHKMSKATLRVILIAMTKFGFI